jgi:hypothetical protein
VAAATPCAATATSHYVAGHPGAGATSAPALTHGFGVAFYVLAALAATAAIAVTLLVESKRTLAAAGMQAAEVVPQAA